ncbi:hypothetical protein [Lentisphaera araneosa]|uniref:hypothetical protein n=1 Tax=Lentisphaera araneosa TaxID=256847 RepID=UPI0003064FE3|nr:hypothetical protein [Lentisphaera araneosa]
MKKYYYYLAESDEVYEFDKRLDFRSYLRSIVPAQDDLVSEDQDRWEKPEAWLRKNSKKRKISTTSRTRARRPIPQKSSGEALKVCFILSFLILACGVAYFFIPGVKPSLEQAGLESAEENLRDPQIKTKQLIVLAGPALAKDEQKNLLMNPQSFSVKVGKNEIYFTDDCRINKIIDTSNGQQVSIPHMGDGIFTVKVKNAGNSYAELVLNKVRKEGEHLLIGNGKLGLSFKLEAKADYLALRMNDFWSESGQELMSCELKFNCQDKPRIISLDYMVTHKSHGPSHSLTWPWLWGRSEVNPLGGFAIYFPKSDFHADETLLDIWVDEALPRPVIEGEWSKTVARKWLKEWRAKFEDQSTMVLQASSSGELYNLTDYAIEMGMKKVYLHTDTWRGEYWPHKNSFLHINKDVFPEGEKSLKEYSQHLKSKGLLLALHTVSGAIGSYDPDYLKESVSPKLAVWNEAVLHSPIDEKDTDVLIKVEKGAVIPKTVAGHEWFAPNSNYSWLDLKCFKVGDEFLFPREIIDNKNGTWLLKNCRRGGIETKAQKHAKGSPTKAYYRPYGQSFTAGVDNGMLEDLVAKIANFYNSNEITHLELDGLEIHMSRPWGSQKFAWLLNQKINHQYMSNTSGGKPLPFQVDYWFKSSSKVMANHPTGGVAGGDGVPIISHNSKRLATSPYEIHLKPTQRLGQKGKTVNFMRPIPMFGVSEKELNNYGLSSYLAEQVKSWKKALSSASSRDQMKAKELPEQFKAPLGYATNQRAFSELIRPIAHGAGFEKFRVMGNKDSINWGWGQEYGPLVPKVYFQSNDRKSMSLENPYADQVPEFILRIMPSFNKSDRPLDGAKSHEELQEKTKEIVESYHNGAGLANANHPLSQAQQIWAAELIAGESCKLGNFLIKREFIIDDLTKINLANYYFHTDEHSLVQLNGERVFRGGHGSKTLMLDISKFLRQGKNELIVQVNNGNKHLANYASAIELHLEGSKQVYPSNKQWLCMTDFDQHWNHKGEVKGEWQPCTEVSTYGQGKYTRANVKAVYQSLNLMPKNQKVIHSNKNQDLALSNDVLVLTQSESISKDKYYVDDRPMWSVQSSMRKARGLKMVVEGDASGALLVVTLRGRGEKDYILPINFKGEKEVVIPCGEVASSNANWSWRTGINYFDYKDIHSLRLGFGKVLAGSKPRVKIKALELMEERQVQVNEIQVTAGNNKLEIKGAFQTGEYLWYQGGGTVGVYDQNWNKLREVKVDSASFDLAQGHHNFSIKTAGASPFIEAQFFVKAKL